MRIAAVAAVALTAAAVGCGSASSAPSASPGTAAPGSAAQQPATALTITFWERGRTETATPKRWTLRCGPVAGTHSRRAEACRKLNALKAPFAPLPRDVVCTQIYGGPQQALVTGRHRGNPVWAQFSLTDGCQIDRFKRIAFLVPGFTVGAGGSVN